MVTKQYAHVKMRAPIMLSMFLKFHRQDLPFFFTLRRGISLETAQYYLEKTLSQDISRFCIFQEFLLRKYVLKISICLGVVACRRLILCFDHMRPLCGPRMNVRTQNTSCGSCIRDVIKCFAFDLTPYLAFPFNSL